MEHKPYPHDPRYLVYRDGRIYSTISNKFLKPQRCSSGRFQIRPAIDGRLVHVHRVVLESFVGPCPDGMEACHNNCDYSDNRLDNLRWDTKSENMRDEKWAGKSGKLSPHDVLAIRARCAAGEHHTAIAEDFGVHRNYISLVHTRHRHADIKEVNGRPVRRRLSK